MRIKQLLTITLSLAALVGVAHPVGAQPAANTVYVLPTSQSVIQGNQVSVELWWDFSAEPTIGGGVDISFDAGRLSFVSYTASGDAALDPGFHRAPDVSPGLLTGIAAGNFNGVGGPVKIGTLVFNALGFGVANLTTSENAAPAGPFVSNTDFQPYGPGEIDFVGAEISIPVCGDSVPGAGEECDDGNTTSGDGCSATCQIEPGADCTPAVAGNPPVPSVCTFQVCGDSEPGLGEECDDGNTTPGDGCDATCLVEAGADCTAAIPGVTTDNLVLDGSFELGDGSWSITDWDAGRCDQVCSGGTNFAFDGDYWLWVGGTGDVPDSGFASQTLVIPANAMTLTFKVLSAAGGCGDSTMAVDIDGNSLWTYEDQGYGECLTTAPFNYEQVSLDVSAFADGGSHTITLSGDYVPLGGGENANWFFDDFRIEVPRVPPDPPIPSSCLVGWCGDGIQSSGETCDDGNTASGDGCSASCSVEEDQFYCEPGEDPLDVLGGSLGMDEDIADGGLEETGPPNPFWQETGTEFTPICSEALCGAALAEDGAFFAWFGGSDLPNLQTLSQVVTISASAEDLSFDLLIGVCDSESDKLQVLIDGNVVFDTGLCTPTSAYQPQSIDLGPYNDGGTHTIVFRGNTLATNGGNSNFFVDNISIEYAAIPDRAPKASTCFALAEACGPIEKFEGGGIPPGWTVVNLEPGASWGTTDDGICGSANWPGGNTTGGSGAAACIDSDAFGPGVTDSYLCTPELDLSTTAGAGLWFLIDYQTVSYDAGEFFEFVIGTVSPNALTLPNAYTQGATVIDHATGSLDLSEALVGRQDLSAFDGEPSVWVCAHYGGDFSWYAELDNVALRADDCTASFCGDGVVNPGEECDGGACCSDVDCTYLPQGTECRAAAGVCDLADVCDGVSTDCSADLKDSTTICRPGSGDPNGSGFTCDPDETCDGVDNDCPADIVEDQGTVCDQGSGDPNGSGFVCDPDEVCSGTPGEACPADTFEDQGTVCNQGSGDPNGSGFVCDPDEVCSGVAGDACPEDTYEPSDTICNAGSGDPTGSGFVCDPDEYCPGAADAACPTDEFEPSTTVCRADAGECDVADLCTGVADEGCPKDLKDPCALVTDSSLCQFDVDEASCGNDDDQFRLLFTPDVKNWVAYKHNASNPGQYYYNLVSEDLDGEVEITIAYPFVTQGAQPIHVYCAEDVSQDADACFLPEEAEASFAFTIAIEDYIESTMDPNRLMLDCQPPTGIPGPNDEGSCSFQVDLGALDLSGCSTGQAYVNVHLDWGLKGPMVDANPFDGGADRYDRGAPSGAYSDALVNTATDDGPDAISNCRSFEFQHTANGGYLADAVQNVNVFKPIAGAMGTVSSSLTGEGVPGVSVALVRNSTGEVVKTGVSDEDGFYTLAYKHRGKKAPYTVFLLGGYDLLQGIELKANGWGEISFDVYTGTSTAEFGTGAGGSSEGGVCDNDGVCEAGEDCASCVNDCEGQTRGKQANRFCCGNGVPEPAEGNGGICDGNF